MEPFAGAGMCLRVLSGASGKEKSMHEMHLTYFPCPAAVNKMQPPNLSGADNGISKIQYNKEYRLVERFDV